MRHRVSTNKLSKSSSHRKAMFRNMLTSLLRHERITTTFTKAKELRPIAEKMITRGRVPSLHNRRLVARDIKDKAVANKLFAEIGPRFLARAGGYTRILKLGKRLDSSEMALIELVERSQSVSADNNKLKKKSQRPSQQSRKEKNEQEEANSPDTKKIAASPEQKN